MANNKKWAEAEVRSLYVSEVAATDGRERDDRDEKRIKLDTNIQKLDSEKHDLIKTIDDLIKDMDHLEKTTKGKNKVLSVHCMHMYLQLKRDE